MAIDVLIIDATQQRKPRFSLPLEILTELHNLPLKNIDFLFFLNADSQFLINPIIHSILITLLVEVQT